ncbi:hypothetical protein [Colwellia sp. E2M01]|uniref:hypothetical protein n=1 Tax=Colwellia sp. E2M01 TaxID=2841561 RepID=UPI001C08FC83|nr:hypothetical protein [Colwellia sp. E2M01]MBU2870232.1 hypothetical protein [Colwellia sp. E2M01]
MTKTFSYSQALLAGAIAFFAFALFSFTLKISPFIDAVNKTTNTINSVTPHIEKIITEVSEVRTEVGKVRLLLTNQTPAILTQVQATLPVVESVIEESKNYSTQLPQLLAQITKIEEQVAILQANLPAILQRVDEVVKTTNNTTAEVALWRPQSLQYLNEIKLSRTYIPEYLTRAQNTVNDAKTIGEDASSGIVSGLLKGVINLPLDVFTGVKGIVKPGSKSAENLTANDVLLIKNKVISLLNSQDQHKAFWQSSDSGNSGTIVKGATSSHDKKQCIELTFNNYFKSGEEVITQLMCLNDEGVWLVN